MNSQKTSMGRYIMIGGFLGAGKTTSVARLARRLSDQGRRVGLITNDQGNALVDTAFLRSRGFATEEIAGGCFCCRFQSLLEAAQRLTTANRPDIFITEPVGSCTDLVATVSYPLRRIYGTDFMIAPLSVLVDPIRALRIFGLEPGGKFSEKVRYIYRKQLQEADVIVINKCDLIDRSGLDRLRQTFATQFPQAQIFEVSARSGDGLDEWFEFLSASAQSARSAIELDYDLYAQGEALLGWLNASLQIASPKSFDGNALLKALAAGIQTYLQTCGAEIAHLKMSFSPDDAWGQIATLNLVRNDFIPELSQSLEDLAVNGQLILNLRAEASPETLRDALDQALAIVPQEWPELTIHVEHLERFQPAKPVPTHRITEPEEAEFNRIHEPEGVHPAPRQRDHENR